MTYLLQRVVGDATALLYPLGCVLASTNCRDLGRI